MNVPTQPRPQQLSTRIPVAKPARAGCVIETNADAPPALLRLMFYVFVFSLPLLHTVMVVEDTRLTKVLGGFFLLTSLLHPRTCYGSFPAAFWWFVAYAGVYAVLGAFQQPGYEEETWERLFTVMQLLLMFWISSNLLRHERIARDALLAVMASCAILAVLQVAGAGGGSSQPAWSGVRSARVAVLGQNPNELACTFALALIAGVGLAYGRDRDPMLSRYLAWGLLIILAIAIVLTQSRGGLVALVAGLVTFVLFQGNLQSRLRKCLVGLLLLGLIVLISLQSEAGRRRWEEGFAGDLAHREALYPAAWHMFEESPFVGWGPVLNTYELGARVRDAGWANPEQAYRDTHNLVLWVLTETGLLGTIPFFIGLWLCLRAAWSARQTIRGVLPLALMITLLVANMSGNWVHFKLNWLILAYCVASGGAPFLKKLRTGDGRLHWPTRQVVLTTSR